MSIQLPPPVTSPLTQEQFLTLYEKGLNPFSFKIFRPIQFMGPFGRENLTTRSLVINRAQLMEGYATFALLINIFNTVVFGLVLQNEPLTVLSVSVSLGTYVYMKREATQLTSVVLLVVDCGSENLEHVADALIGAGPSILQRTWSCGTLDEQLLKSCQEAINAMGQALLSKNLTGFSNHRLTLIENIRLIRHKANEQISNLVGS